LLTWTYLLSFVGLITSFSKIKKQRPPNKKKRRPGDLLVSTHLTNRSMALRPHLTMGLPFRYTGKVYEVDPFNIILSVGKNQDKL